MEAKDTVMPELYTKSIYMGSDYHPSFKLPLEMKHSLDRVTQAQAEITWPTAFKAGHEEGYKLAKHDMEVTHFDAGRKAGIREVVELAEKFLTLAEHGDYSNGVEFGGMDEGRVRAYELLQQYRQELLAKLKEWGLEEE